MSIGCETCLKYTVATQTIVMSIVAVILAAGLPSASDIPKILIKGRASATIESVAMSLQFNVW
ncbi:hypothetical protein LQF57_06840 [Tetragenococcus koreensis]|uniref:hypothetical protein n=1 Tax=Tetragenococcus koreensis TaxID=290335 RepID=UPI001F33EF56|nr:hypothetical protein [Tetragenococcus koreensis]MCF1657310.1 hypothetical protein [Tetragenococcus koreensis]MDN6290079.1 hypothetical protein [Tetragenococcus koreensis]